MNEQEFLAALAKFAPSVRQAFIDAVQDITDNAILAQVVEALERGDAEAAWRSLGYQPSVFNRLVSALRVTFEQGALATLLNLPLYATDALGVKSLMRFDIRNKRAEDWLADQSSSLITQIEDEMRSAVRNTLQAGLAEGRNPTNTALDIVGRYNQQTGHREGGVIGLGEREEYWSRSTRTKLLTLDRGYFDLTLRDKRFDATVQAAIDAGKPLPIETVDKLVDRYRSNALKFRGDNIGRTETLSALNRGEYESVRQALERSDLPTSAARKVWKTARDNRVRPDHQAMQNVSVGIDEPFVLPDGSRMMHPTDTSLGAAAKEVVLCRCKAKYEIDFAARLSNG